METTLETYLVGGAVRDRLLGIEVRDRDYVVVGATAERMKALGFRQVGADFPVFLHPATREQYALARTERKVGAGYHGFSVDFSPLVTLEDDLRRRDLTINALAEDEAGEIIDPYGGLKDIQARKLRHVSEAFKEDPVRILRTARFAARFANLGFEIAAETQALMAEMVRAGEASHLVTERVWQEWADALADHDPRRFIQELRHCGAYAILVPELEQLYAIHPGVNSGSAGELGERALAIATTLTDSAEIRFAALVCTSVMAASFPPAQADAWIERLCRRLAVPKSWQQLTGLATAHQTRCHQAEKLDGESLLQLLESTDAFRRPERFDQLLLTCQASLIALEHQSGQPSVYPQADYLKQSLALASAVPVTPLLEKGLRGEAIKEALHNARLDALKTGLEIN